MRSSSEGRPGSVAAAAAPLPRGVLGPGDRGTPETGRRGFPTHHPSGGVDPQHLRRVLRRVPTSLAVVTTMDGASPAGCTIGSFVSVSLDPPLAAYFAMRSSSTLAAVRRRQAFSVNVLADDQADLAAVFSGRSANRFRGVRWQPGPGGTPHLDGALVVLDCELHDVVTLGDHEMVVGRLTGASVTRPGIQPLVLGGGRVRELQLARPSGLDDVAFPA